MADTRRRVVETDRQSLSEGLVYARYIRSRYVRAEGTGFAASPSALASVEVDPDVREKVFYLPKLFRDLDLERTPIGESARGDQRFVAAALLDDIVAYGFQKEGGGTGQQRRQGGQFSNGQLVIGDRRLQLGPAHEPHRN